MAEAALKEELEKHLKTLGQRVGGIEPEDLIEAVGAITGSINDSMSASGLKVYAEIDSLARFISSAKKEIAAIRPDEIKDDYLPMATDELTAIVGATEKATNTIFEAVEKIEELTERMEPEVAEGVTDEVTKVYEACGFQDITGQRITKIVSALTEIEDKVEAILKAFGAEMGGQPKSEKAKQKTKTPKGNPARPDEDLLNGPQSETEAVSQDDVDALLGF